MSAKLNNDAKIHLSRDCKAVMVPSGENVILSENTEVVLYQKLGQNYTIIVANNLARISGENGDALGFEKIKKNDSLGLVIDETSIITQLRDCYDPEIPVNIVDLGLIYNCDLNFNSNNQVSVNIIMTLTAPGCAMGPVLLDDIKSTVLRFDNINDVNIEIVFDPQWNMDMISESGKLQLGLI